jgi:glycerophosphoryl diester phosphodiesterase
MQILSHRGYHRDLPENTMVAFEAAVKLGVDGIETDLRWSADGQIVLYHDRLAPDRREVREHTVAELTKLAGYSTPTLTEALDAYPDVLWNLEIKEPAVLPALIPLLKKYRATHKLLVTSFWHPAVEEVKKAVDVECGLLTAHRPLDPVGDRLGRFTDNSQVAIFVWHYDYLSPELVAQTVAMHGKNYVYSAHTRADHEYAMACGIDGIITDDPPLAREILNAKTK